MWTETRRIDVVGKVIGDQSRGFVAPIRWTHVVAELWARSVSMFLSGMYNCCVLNIIGDHHFDISINNRFSTTRACFEGPPELLFRPLSVLRWSTSWAVAFPMHLRVCFYHYALVLHLLITLTQQTFKSYVQQIELGFTVHKHNNTINRYLTHTTVWILLSQQISSFRQ